MSSKYFVPAAIACLSLSPQTKGAVVISLTGNPTTGPAFYLGFAGNAVVPDGSLIRIGTFETPPVPNLTFAHLLGSFREFGRTTMGNSQTAAANTGHPVRNNIVGSSGPESPDPDSYFIGKNVYIWVYSDADGDPAGLGPQGIFATSLTYKDQPAAVSTSTTTYVYPFGRGDLFSTPASVTYNAQNQVTRFNLASAIPEPSFAALFGLLSLAAISRRRR